MQYIMIFSFFLFFLSACAPSSSLKKEEAEVASILLENDLEAMRAKDEYRNLN